VKYVAPKPFGRRRTIVSGISKFRLGTPPDFA
jgi:hypothetical protein